VTRSCEEIYYAAGAVDPDDLVGITIAEARQFTRHWRPGDWDGYPQGPWPPRLHGRVCLITDLPPGHYMTPYGHVLPLIVVPPNPSLPVEDM